MNDLESEQIQWLVDKEKIRELLFSFARCLDTKDVDGYINNYTENGILELPKPNSATGEVVTISKERMREFVKNGIMTLYRGTHHISSNHQITVTGDTAESRSYLQAVHVRESPFDHWDAGGWYDCKLVRKNDGWKFLHVKLTVIWLSGDPDNDLK